MVVRIVDCIETIILDGVCGKNWFSQKIIPVIEKRSINPEDAYYFDASNLFTSKNTQEGYELTVQEYDESTIKKLVEDKNNHTLYFVLLGEKAARKVKSYLEQAGVNNINILGSLRLY